ncbi:thioredoxin-related transmembrane protein 4 isoform X2 [Calonectris borealis]|uniref:thioredoxin-related transmembrane protein 4 isoform X2 n=1 Tax=Calonectris borealis TaxID=1323832 RepID=UPI003F4CA5A6
MAAGRWGGRRFLCAAAALLLAAVLGPAAAVSSRAGSPGELRSRVQVLGGSNWSLVLQGQWMLEFYAPWCPACQQIELTWESFAKESEHLDITVGKVDVTQEPGLSGRFFVTTLPTIYQMHGMAGLFHLSGWIRQIHSYLTGTLGIHVWISYAIFILATLLIGLFLGLILVLISDCLCPSKSRYRAETPEEAITKDNVENAALEEPEEAAELSADDAEETADVKDVSDGEDAANSSADDSEEDLALGKESGEEEIEDLSEQPLADSETESSVRQRKSQVADNGL